MYSGKLFAFTGVLGLETLRYLTREMMICTERKILFVAP
jgi:hypothetical protein